MQHLDLSDDEEAAALARELDDIIGNDCYPISERICTLKAKLRPEPVREPLRLPKACVPPCPVTIRRRRQPVAMTVPPTPREMSLYATISYVAERSDCAPEKASIAVLEALREGALLATANTLRNDHDKPRLDFVPAKLWAGYTWLEFYDRSGPRGNTTHRQRTTDGEAVGLFYINPRIATHTIDAWIEREGNQDDRVVRAYRDLDLHPVIAEAANKLYLDGHYANAIEAAIKALCDCVRLHGGKSLDGADLMKTVFSPKNPILRFNDFRDRSDHDEQEGYMMMFAGAVTGLRNPRAHKLSKDDPEDALEFIAHVSHLAKLLDRAKRA
jgi:uncharacterized protein (TIGR02391 family)